MNRSTSPLHKVEFSTLIRPNSPIKSKVNQNSEVYQCAIQKLYEAAWKFNKARDGDQLQALDSRELDKSFFRQTLRSGAIWCSLSSEELEAILPHFQNGDKVDGCQFLLFFYRLRFDFRRKLLQERVETERFLIESAKAQKERKNAAIRDKLLVEIDLNCSKSDHESMISKLTSASMKFDRLNPGVAQLEAFECEYLRADIFWDQLKRIFGIDLTPKELGALVLSQRSQVTTGAAARRASPSKRKKPIETDASLSFSFLLSDASESEYEAEVEGDAGIVVLSAPRSASRPTRDPVLSDTEGDSTEQGEARNFQRELAKKNQIRFVSGTGETLQEEEEPRVYCASFLVLFYRLGFTARSEKIKKIWKERKIREQEDLVLKKKGEEEEEKANIDKVSYDYTDEDRDRAIQKLRVSARLYDKTTPGAKSMKAFEVAAMPPHILKDQLFRIFNLRLNAKELGALVDYFDANRDGQVSCQEFTKAFLMMGFVEREKEREEFKQTEKAAEQKRQQEAEAKQRLKDQRNALQVSYEYTEEEFQSAMMKLTESAWKFDRNAPDAPPLTAFDTKDMEPHVFKEQLKIAFRMNLTPTELGAIVSQFDREGTGKIMCGEFLGKYFKIGIEERERRRKKWLEHVEEKRRVVEVEQSSKLTRFQRKVQHARDHVLYTEQDYHSAFSKLASAAVTYDRHSPSCIRLEAFEASKMPSDVFREQMKLLFRIILSVEEMAALMTHFDPQNTGQIDCKNFVFQFLRTGVEERQRLQLEWVQEKQNRIDKSSKLSDNKKNQTLNRNMADIDFEFTEPEFDAALHSLIEYCSTYDLRFLGPPEFTKSKFEFYSPTEFREMAKRTFNWRLTAKELGCMVTYFDVNMKAVIDCTALLQAFVHIRSHVLEFRGKPRAEKLLDSYHTQLKNQYKYRVLQQAQIQAGIQFPGMESEEAGGRTSAKPPRGFERKPWKTLDGVTTSSSSSSTSNLLPSVAAKKKLLEKLKEKKKSNPPLTPLDKVNLRLSMGKRSGIIDLSTKAMWGQSFNPFLRKDSSLSTDSNQESLEEKSNQIPPITDDSNLPPLPISSISSTNSIGSLPTDRSSETQISLPNGCSELSMEQRAREVQIARVSKAKSILGKKYDNKFDSFPVIDEEEVKTTPEYRLNFIPHEVFQITEASQLWLCNNLIETVPLQIASMRNLKVLSLSGNKLRSLPWELCLLTNLQSLYLARNQLRELPTRFSELTNLKDLSVAGNDFISFPEQLISLPKLETLNLSGNFLTTLPPRMKSMRSLSQLILNENPSLVASPPLVLFSMHWIDVHGINMKKFTTPLLSPLSSPPLNSPLTLPSEASSKSCYSFKITFEEEEELMDLLKSRARRTKQGPIVNKLGRTKGMVGLRSLRTMSQGKKESKP